MELDGLTQLLSQQLIEKNWRLSVAESCTGGLVSKTCTDQPGSSSWFDRGFITYSNSAKADMLHVAKDLIDNFGAVSKQVAEAMVRGAIRHSQSQVALSITGIAGPDGGSDEKPVGTVWIGWNVNNAVTSECFIFKGDRTSIRNQSTQKALEQLIKYLNKNIP